MNFSELGNGIVHNLRLNYALNKIVNAYLYGKSKVSKVGWLLHCSLKNRLNKQAEYTAGHQAKWDPAKVPVS